MVILMGMTCTGKDTVCKKLCDEYGYKKIVQYTTRPMREGEVDGETYHFISDNEFGEKVFSGFFMEFTYFETKEGNWYYGTAKEDVINADSRTIVILNPKGYFKYKSEINWKIKQNYIVVLLKAPPRTISKRWQGRGDDPKEAKRRVKSDSFDFDRMDMWSDLRYENNIHTDIDELVKQIYEDIESRIWEIKE